MFVMVVLRGDEDEFLTFFFLCCLLCIVVLDQQLTQEKFEIIIGEFLVVVVRAFYMGVKV